MQHWVSEHHPTKTWAIYLFIKWNWNERTGICIYITPFIYGGYQSTLQTPHRNHFTTDEEWAALDWKMEALHSCTSSSDSTATSLLLTNRDYLDLSNKEIKFTSWMSWKGFFTICTKLLLKNSVWKWTRKFNYLGASGSIRQIEINLILVEEPFLLPSSSWGRGLAERKGRQLK